jgi:uncharacterized membrane protein
MQETNPTAGKTDGGAARPAGDPSALALLGAAGLGAALMYAFDPGRGARRRKMIADRLVHAGHVAADAAGVTRRDVSNRARGVAARARALGSDDDADDRVIEERVRAELGRVVSHPGAIAVTATDGWVTLAGPVLAREKDNLLARTRGVRGVTGVVDQLEAHETAESVPALQGGVERTGSTFELRQENWTPAARLLTGVAGSALALYGARRRGPVGTALGLAGLALFTRGAANTDLARVTGVGGGRRAVDVQKTINVSAPPDEVFGWITEWESFPQWMSHVREVTASGPRGAVGERTHWVVDGPAGVPIAWDAETTKFEPGRLVSWKTVEGSTVEHAGTLQIAPNADRGTRVHVRMTYRPPAGAVGHVVAAFFGRDPKRQMDDDLMRLKSTIEGGQPPRDAAAASGAGSGAATAGAPGTAQSE